MHSTVQTLLSCNTTIKSNLLWAAFFYFLRKKALFHWNNLRRARLITVLKKGGKRRGKKVESQNQVWRKVFSLWKEKALACNFPFSHLTSSQFHQIPISVLNNFANSKEKIAASSEKSGSLKRGVFFALHCSWSWSCLVTVADWRKGAAWDAWLLVAKLKKKRGRTAKLYF